MVSSLDVISHRHLRDEDETLAFGGELAGKLRDRGEAVVHLQGDLGAGKTTFARGFLTALGHVGVVRSPTYTLIESYPLQDVVVHHLDLYRLGSPDELFDLGLDDLAVVPAIWLIEWPTLADGALPPWTHRVSLAVNGTGRDVELSHRHCVERPA